MSHRSFGRPLLASLLVVAVAASAAPAPRISVIGAWTRPALAGMTGAGYLTIVNHGGLADRLVSASSPAAASVTLHQSRQVGGMMTMRAVPFLTIAAHGQTALAPGGFHLMLLRLKRPLRIGQTAPVTLVFAGAGPLRVSLEVRDAGPPGTGT